ncbi:DUF7919 family protein [Nannocystis radixulma]|uniref:DUF7919 domain-containing protein n=1 Tax=Nannocystis radixulma TaxID=2995305 RepID=A0ABT5BDL5_9BACT|nr:hypothetical protein [Nannocystis radixulma]MDC0672242.1 hypothetical protein [Nannocystis radixulma]
MTYAADLTPYAYGMGQDDGETPDLHIGWLSSGHAYPKQPPDPAFVQALLRCCLRPERLYMGYHVCDLGCEHSGQPRQLTRDYDGRTLFLGNGEIRVTGADRQVYAAPTLIAHYVADHHYAPPTVFVDAVTQLARRLWALQGEPLERVRRLDGAARFALCIDALQALQRARPRPWLADMLATLDEGKPGVVDLLPILGEQRRRKLFQRLRDLQSTCPLDDAPLAKTVVALHYSFPVRKRFFSPAQRSPQEEVLMVWATAQLLEQAHEAGLEQWRDDVRPRRGDEPG